MTRYANLGFKRKYVQAGFDGAEDQTAAKGRTAEAPEATPNAEPAKKKLKPVKKKKASEPAEKTSEEKSGVETSQPGSKSGEGEAEKPPLSNRKLYKLRRQQGLGAV